MNHRLLARGLALASALLLGIGWLGYVMDWPIDDTLLGLLAGLGCGGLLAAALLWWMPGASDVRRSALNRRYLREFLPAMLGYVLTLFASIWLLGRVGEPGLRALVALAPVPWIALAMRAIVRHIRDSDELQRRIELEAVCIATASVSLAFMAAGFLQVAKVIDVPAGAAMLWVFPLVCLAYGFAKLVVARRYS